MIALIDVLRDRLTLTVDESEEAALGDGCGFTEEDIAAAPQPVIEDLESDD